MPMTSSLYAVGLTHLPRVLSTGSASGHWASATRPSLRSARIRFQSVTGASLRAFSR